MATSRAKRPNQRVTKEDSLVVKRDDLMRLVDANEAHLAALLPAHISPAHMKSLIRQAVTRNPDLLKATRYSLFQALLMSVQLGLSPDGMLGEAYLIPFKTQGGETTITFIPGYKGLVKLALRSGKVQRIEAHVVYESDQFDFAMGTAPFVTHRWGVDDRLDSTMDGITHFYAVAFYADDSKQFEVMTIEQVLGIQARARASRGPWQTDPVQMGRKTVVRRLCNLLPLSPDLETALRLEAEMDNNVPQTANFELVDIPPEAIEAPETPQHGAGAPEEAPEPNATSEPPPAPAPAESGAEDGKGAAPKTLLCMKCENDAEKVDAKSGLGYCANHMPAAMK
jgi:recombination protein RecT